MNIPEWAWLIRDRARFDWRDRPGAIPTCYLLYWKEDSPNAFRVHHLNDEYCNGHYSFGSLMHSMKMGSTIDGKTLEELEAWVPQIPDEDFDFEITIL